ncbi:MAG: hypothetical protein JSR60_19265 [Proteobacteria bacterium]|nr:hypothetical protein [Pseudomonadota bacterium]
MPQLAQLQRPRPLQHAGSHAARAGHPAVAQLAEDLNARSQNRGLAALAQRLPVQRVPAAPDAAHVAEARWELGRAAQRKPLTTALLGSASQAPLQMAGWRDYVPSWRTVGIVGAGLAAGALASTGFGLPAATAIGLGLTGSATVAATHAGGIGAGLGTAALGTAGVLSAGMLPALAAPVVGALAGGATGLVRGSGEGAIGAVVGGLAPAVGLAGLGSGFGAAIGADTQSALTRHPVVDSGQAAPPVSDVILFRATEMAKAQTGKKTPSASDIATALGKPLSDRVQRELNKISGEGERKRRLSTIIHFQTRGIGGPGDEGRKVTAPALNEVRRVLLATPFIRNVLTEKGPKSDMVSLNRNAPPESAKARQVFNRLVSRRYRLPNITAKRGSYLNPVSSMSDDGTMTEGFAATRDTMVHEMGHHLENNLSPLEFGTLHNFMQARSGGWNFRNVGWGYVNNKRDSDVGYDTNTPNPVPGESMPLTRLGVSLIGHGLGLEAGEAGIDRFLDTHSHTQKGSYATKVYDPATAARTEFLSTTIHLMARGDSAQKLIQADPLRVCVFLHVAQPGVYEQVRKTLSKSIPPVDLDSLISRVKGA